MIARLLKGSGYSLMAVSSMVDQGADSTLRLLESITKHGPGIIIGLPLPSSGPILVACLVKSTAVAIVALKRARAHKLSDGKNNYDTATIEGPLSAF